MNAYVKHQIDSSVLSSDALFDGFFINGIHVCPRRGEINFPSGGVSLEPKVMEVLLELCKQNGDVISPEALFSTVWPKSIYNPVSVRRCIALIRKAFGDEDKVLIKTHPKRGYSLSAKIESIQSQATQIDRQVSMPDGNKHNVAYYITVVSVLIFVFIGVWYALIPSIEPPTSDGEKSKAWRVSELRPITASAAEESFSQFINGTNDIVYITNRISSVGIKHSQLWHKNVNSGNATMLFESMQPILYFAMRYKNDQVAETNTSHIVVAIKQGNGVIFQQLSFDDNWQLTEAMNQAAIEGANWVSPFIINLNNIYFLAKVNGVRSLYVASLLSDEVALVMAESSNFSPYRITRSQEHSAITLLGFDQDHLSQVKQLSLHSKKLELIATLDANWYFIDKHPSEEGYLLSDGKSLFQLKNNGKMFPISFENYDFLHYPQLSLNGEMLAYTQTKIKGDISTIGLTTNAQVMLVESNRHDWQGVISPDRKKLAYVSNRNGYSQLFVFDMASQHSVLVYDNPDKHLALSRPVWSPDSAQLASARNDHLFTVNLSVDTPIVTYFDDVVGQPRQWYQEENALLIAQDIHTSIKWSKLNLLQSNITQLGITTDNAILTAEDEILLMTSTTIAGVNGNTIWQVEKGQRIIQHFAQFNGVYFIVEAEQASENVRTIWFYDYALETTHELSKIDTQGYDVSDVNSDVIVVSSFDVEKDIVMLDVHLK